jgi:hypothetical protein
MQENLLQSLSSNPLLAAGWMVLVFLGYTLLGVVPAAGAVYLLYFLLTLPMRRNERARIFLDSLELGLRQGKTAEDSIIAGSASRDRSFGARFYLLAEYLREGKRLSVAVRLVPRLLPPQVRRPAAEPLDIHGAMREVERVARVVGAAQHVLAQRCADLLDEFGVRIVAVTEQGGSVIKSRGQVEEATPSTLFVFNPAEPHAGWMGWSERWQYRSMYLTSLALDEVVFDMKAGATMRLDLRRAGAPFSVDVPVVDLERPTGRDIAWLRFAGAWIQDVPKVLSREGYDLTGPVVVQVDGGSPAEAGARRAPASRSCPGR